MEERIQTMLDLLKSGNYDPQTAHTRYDKLLEDFIKEGCIIVSYPKMFDLLEVEKEFWYA